MLLRTIKIRIILFLIVSCIVLDVVCRVTLVGFFLFNTCVCGANIDHGFALELQHEITAAKGLYTISLHTTKHLINGTAADRHGRKLQYTGDLVPNGELDALCALYDQTDGENWLWSGVPWNFTDPLPCANSWQGVTCNCAFGPCFIVMGVGYGVRYHLRWATFHI